MSACTRATLASQTIQGEWRFNRASAVWASDLNFRIAETLIPDTRPIEAQTTSRVVNFFFNPLSNSLQSTISTVVVSTLSTSKPVCFSYLGRTTSSRLARNGDFLFAQQSTPSYDGWRDIALRDDMGYSPIGTSWKFAIVNIATVPYDPELTN
jgi:hypothetical protein